MADPTRDSTLGGWVGSVNATTVLYSPPPFTSFNLGSRYTSNWSIALNIYNPDEIVALFCVSQFYYRFTS